MGRREEHAREVVRRERHALLRQPRAHRVHPLEARDHPIDAGEPLLDHGDPRVGLVGRALRRRVRKHDLPGHRHAVGRILREELVQDRRARARQTDDDDRALDTSGGDLGMPGARRHHAQPVGEEAHEVGARDHATEQRQGGLALEPVEQQAERRPKRVVSEVVETRGARGARHQTFRVEVEERNAGRAHHPPDAVQQANPERMGGNGVGHARALEHTRIGEAKPRRVFRRRDLPC